MMVTCANSACKAIVAWSSSHCPSCRTRVPRNLRACKDCRYGNPDEYLVCHHCMHVRTDEKTYLLDAVATVPALPTPKEAQVARIATVHIKVNLNDPKQVKRLRMLTTESSSITVSRVRPAGAWKELFDDESPTPPVTPVVRPSQTHLHVVYIKGCDNCERQWDNRHDHSVGISYRSTCVACKAGHKLAFRPPHTHANFDSRITWSPNCLACPLLPPGDTARAGASSSSAAQTRAATIVRSLHERLPKPDKIEEVMMPLLGDGEAGVEVDATESAQ